LEILCIIAAAVSLTKASTKLCKPIRELATPMWRGILGRPWPPKQELWDLGRRRHTWRERCKLGKGVQGLKGRGGQCKRPICCKGPLSRVRPPGLARVTTSWIAIRFESETAAIDSSRGCWRELQRARGAWGCLGRLLSWRKSREHLPPSKPQRAGRVAVDPLDKGEKLGCLSCNCLEDGTWC
jgi:hypothetical protein